MAKSIPELAPPTTNFHATPEGEVNMHQVHKHDGSSVESSLEPRPSGSKVTRSSHKAIAALLTFERGISFMKLNTIFIIFESKIVQRQKG
ncbi:hypothetical protein AVEN_244059-1 [Araneus ventricosus]|uniref:Uncharacterized protein n=1 Tax=Araneus ventricosus TaxID=182803 RepID=A0A4Y2IJT5_ARAVE|nr:hypothetical protein AVEN_244059-1 [Araneus ventricosus]